MPKTGRESDGQTGPADVRQRAGAFTCVSLFAGGGGMALGFEQAGLAHVLLNEFDRHAVATLRANRPGWTVDSRDIRELNFLHLRGAVDVVEGGFPCQAFSASGKRQGFSDPRGALFFEFARAVREIRPRMVVAENVKGLRGHEGGRTLGAVVTAFEEAGYQVAWRVLGAHRHGVPQRRERLILIARRGPGSGPLLFPPEADGPPPTVREAIAGLPAGPGARYSARMAWILSHVPEGGNWRDLPEHVLREFLPNGPYGGGSCSGAARRLRWDEPSPMLLCTPMSKLTERCHPSQTRPLSVREYARLQTFPDDWAFSGPVSAQYRQIGNAVPVTLAYHLGRTAVAMLTGAGTAGFSQAQHLVKPQRLRRWVAVGAQAGRPRNRPTAGRRPGDRTTSAQQKKAAR
ncbi:DNA (cytosine-5-)-methyltransferase [Frankia sp. Mgl5]|uniref:DNA cytosine methyltransferase n=1 Tax=Frankia sp. Mgl5 TaxID=2933793 RepID=UPI002551CCBC|nr:DNA (cytosine-5-)-methyltransferase [Frankia sp. Mgl5]MCK9932000.1 DNA (cytosine-5-)-methyltransferase [Frankia sp. Mgl5]